MAEEETNSRIADLKARLEADPGSRVFYQLGEELRKAQRGEEAEAVLRKGLETHSGYLSAWISLGRVLKETSRSREAIEVLNRAFELDRQNVVVARLLGDAYAAIDEDVEAIKKYKLVAALHPADEEIQEKIQALERILGNEERPAPVQPPVPPVEESPPAETAVEPAPEPASLEMDEGPQPEDGARFEAESAEELSWLPEPPESSVAAPEAAEEQESAEPPHGDSIDSSEDESDQSWPGNETNDDVVATVTMGDLYARQGHVEQARSIYRRVLDREPDHQDARERLDSLTQESEHEQPTERAESSSQERKIRRLEEWLAKVGG